MINIIITGDFCLDHRIIDYYNNKNYGDLYGEALSILLDKDISITNIECPLTEVLAPIDKSGPCLKAPPRCIELVKYGGFDVACLANNHILDQGERGLFDTVASCESVGIKTVGVGENIARASVPLIIEIRGHKLAIINIAEDEFSIASEKSAGACPVDPIINYQQITAAQSITNLIIVIIHGGTEHYALPSPQQIKLYRFLADLGVTAVIGHHTHCPNGYEIYKGVPIFYSLGNFIFDRVGVQSQSWYEGYFVKLGIENGKVEYHDIFPYYQCKAAHGLSLMDGEDKRVFLDKISKLSLIIKDPHALSHHWSQFCQDQEAIYLSHFLGLNKLSKKLLEYGILDTLILPKKRVIILQDMIRCDALRNTILTILERRRQIM